MFHILLYKKEKTQLKETNYPAFFIRLIMYIISILQTY
jgi:hypothetical protein